MDTELLIVAVPVALAAVILAVWRFSGGRYGKLRPSSEVSAAYVSFRVDPLKNYYISGPDAWPNAIMGIDRSWALEPGLWKKTEMTSGGMKALVQGMQARAMERMASLNGFAILDGRGGVIGDWFSVPGLNIVVRATGDRRVEIATPPVTVTP
jgi:hypothetical protein